MGLRGRAPTPTEILKLRGSWRAKERTGEPQPERGKPPCPRRLNKTQKAIYRKLVDMLDRLGVLGTIDGGQLERYAVYFDRWHKIEVLCFQFGNTPDALGASLLGKDSRYLLKTLWRESARLDQALKQIEGQFGLTPAARTKLRTDAEGTEESSLNEFKIG